jgi:hypothetical protein
MSRWVLAAALVLAACGSTSGGAARPVIQSFVATPTLVVGDGGTVDLSWSVSQADTVSIAPGVGQVATPASGSLSTHVAGNTTFTLTANGPGGTAMGTTPVQVCDPAPASLTGTCTIQAAGQCVDFSGLGTSDRDALITYCGQLGGQWGTSPCPTANRVGTCQVPPLGPRTGISCSSTAILLERYYPPSYSTSSAQSICATVSGSTFTPG